MLYNIPCKSDENILLKRGKPIMKKISLLLAALLVLTVALCACGSDTTSSASSETSSAVSSEVSSEASSEASSEVSSEAASEVSSESSTSRCGGCLRRRLRGFPGSEAEVRH